MERSSVMSGLFTFLRRRLLLSLLWFGRQFLGWGRLDHIDLVDLGASIAEVVALYEEPIKAESDQYLPEAKSLTFVAGPFHRAIVVEWNQKVCCITYWSVYGDPNRDLKCMLNKYGEGMGWNELEPGYVCVRRDGQVWLRCSVLPAISVETADYLDAKRSASNKC